MKKKVYTAKDVAFDAMFASLSVLLLLTFYFLPFNKNLMGSLLLIFFSCAYEKRSLLSCYMTSLVIVCISFLFMDPLIVLFYVFPSLLFAIFVRKIMSTSKPVFYVTSFLMFALLFLFESYLYTSFFLQEDFIGYIARKGIDLSIFGVDQTTDVGRNITIIGFCVAEGVMALCEAVILDYARQYYDDRLRFLVERKS